MRVNWVRTAVALIATIILGELLTVAPARAQAQFPRDFQVAGKPGAQTSFLGVAVTDIDPDRVSRLKLDEERGIEVTHVAENSPADKAGIQPGDVLLTYNGENILGSQQFVRLVQETPIGRKVKVQVWRNGKTHLLTAEIGSAPAKPFGIPANFANFPVPYPHYSGMMDIPMPILVWQNTLLGAQLEELDKPMAEYFGVKGGMLVRAIENGSPAFQGRLESGRRNYRYWFRDCEDGSRYKLLFPLGALDRPAHHPRCHSRSQGSEGHPSGARPAALASSQSSDLVAPWTGHRFCM
jgi:membrane-associated protease RseP (regulator of RpoE activity)